MYFYEMFGMIFKSNVVIKQMLKAKETDNYDVEIILGEMPDEIVNHINEVKEKYNFFTGKSYMWMYNIYGIFAVYPDGRIYAKSISDATDFVLLQFVLGYCVSMFTQFKEILSMHCGAVLVDNKAIIIAGNSGTGKSTLTTKFINNGAKMISDDIAALKIVDGEVKIYSGFPQQKLCRDVVLNNNMNVDELRYIDSVKDKFEVDRHDIFIREPRNLAAFFTLEKYDPNSEENKQYNKAVHIKEIKGFDKVSIVTRNMFLSAFLGTTGLSARQFQIAVKIAEKIPLYKIMRPDGIDTLEEVISEIENKIN